VCYSQAGVNADAAVAAAFGGGGGIADCKTAAGGQRTAAGSLAHASLRDVAAVRAWVVLEI
jgi:hypothetical protein